MAADPFRHMTNKIDIIAQGKGWLAVDKPAGMSIHNDPGLDLISRATALSRSDRRLARETAFASADGLHAVHRLDKQTSGVVLLATCLDAHKALAAQLSDGRAIKEYLALVHGILRPDKGCLVWQWPLSPNAGGRRQCQGSGPRKGCRTECTVIEYSRRYTLIRCRLITGRKHQIRRHAALAGHPVLGDTRYGSPRACRYLEAHFGFARLALHAALLQIYPPDRPGPVQIVSASLPAKIRALIQNDR